MILKGMVRFLSGCSICVSTSLLLPVDGFSILIIMLRHSHHCRMSCFLFFLLLSASYKTNSHYGMHSRYNTYDHSGNQVFEKEKNNNLLRAKNLTTSF